MPAIDAKERKRSIKSPEESISFKSWADVSMLGFVRIISHLFRYNADGPNAIFFSIVINSCRKYPAFFKFCYLLIARQVAEVWKRAQEFLLFFFCLFSA